MQANVSIGGDRDEWIPGNGCHWDLEFYEVVCRKKEKKAVDTEKRVRRMEAIKTGLAPGAVSCERSLLVSVRTPLRLK